MNNPIPIPSGSTPNYSYRKNLKIKFTSSPSQQISNLRWYMDARPGAGGAASWTGISVYVGATSGFSPSIAGDTSTRVPWVKDVDNWNGGGGVYDSSTPLTINAGTVLSTPSTGYGTQDYATCQMSMDNSVSSGVKALRNAWWRYDEI